MEYFINSNTGDYIAYDIKDDTYRLYLATIYLDYPRNHYNKIGGEYKNITKQQFYFLKGFIPIKGKKLFNRMYRYCFDYYNTYRPTGKGGVKYKPKELIQIPDIVDIRDERLNQLLQ